MKVAILGSRGIPARYGGYDTLVEELSAGLVECGAFEVTVYCRKAYFVSWPEAYRGAYLVYLSFPRMKAAESIVHSFLSSLHVLTQKVDLIYFVDPANAPFCLLLRLCGKKVVLHTDGLGWKRQKWGPLARRYYKFAEWIGVRAANALITDNPAMQAYYKKEYNADSFYIPYGAESGYGVDDTIYEQIGLVPSRYLLVVARLEPDNNTTLIIEEYVKSKVTMPLVIVGDSPYDAEYMLRLRELANERVLFVGRINDQAKLNGLYKGAYLYIHGHEVGGTNPSLLRAMQAATAPTVIDVPFNTSVVGNDGFIFSKEPGNLSGLLQCLVKETDKIKKIGLNAKARVEENFRWEDVVNRHKLLFEKVTVS